MLGSDSKHKANAKPAMRSQRNRSRARFASHWVTMQKTPSFSKPAAMRTGMPDVMDEN